jgi:hypothetical protein
MVKALRGRPPCALLENAAREELNPRQSQFCPGALVGKMSVPFLTNTPYEYAGRQREAPGSSPQPRPSRALALPIECALSPGLSRPWV